MRQFTKRIHMVGIGGAGMSPLAEVLHSHGHLITGSDRSHSATTVRLENMGCKVQYDHTPDLIQNAELLVYSSAVKPDNLERSYARANGIPEIRRADILGELMRTNFTICISGTHGKTTTTSLVGTIFHDAGTNPTVLVGGMLRGIDSHALIGKGGPMIAEADEYDRSFLSMYPSLAIITNVEADHLDCYRDLDDIKNTFVQFTDRLPFYGAVIACNDDAGVQAILPLIKKKIITYGIDSHSDYIAKDISFTSGKPSFTVVHHGTVLGSITLPIPGLHNVRNSLAAIVAGVEMGLDFEIIALSISKFEGVRRRFEIVGNVKGVTIIDDYAHHPGEIKATLEAARKSDYKRVIAVFQPHLYSRTRDFMDQFAESLMIADESIIMSIYKAREEPIPGVTAETIVNKITIQNGKSEYIIDHKVICPLLIKKVKSGDAVIFMGAGDIWEVAAQFVKELGSNE